LRTAAAAVAGSGATGVEVVAVRVLVTVTVVDRVTVLGGTEVDREVVDDVEVVGVLGVRDWVWSQMR
jgi:hypothetical protein